MPLAQPVLSYPAQCRTGLKGVVIRYEREIKSGTKQKHCVDRRSQVWNFAMKRGKAIGWRGTTKCYSLSFLRKSFLWPEPQLAKTWFVGTLVWFVHTNFGLKCSLCEDINISIAELYSFDHSCLNPKLKKGSFCSGRVYSRVKQAAACQSLGEYRIEAKSRTESTQRIAVYQSWGVEGVEAKSRVKTVQ